MSARYLSDAACTHFIFHHALLHFFFLLLDLAEVHIHHSETLFKLYPLLFFLPYIIVGFFCHFSLEVIVFDSM